MLVKPLNKVFFLIVVVLLITGCSDMMVFGRNAPTTIENFFIGFLNGFLLYGSFFPLAYLTLLHLVQTFQGFWIGKDEKKIYRQFQRKTTLRAISIGIIIRIPVWSIFSSAPLFSFSSD